MILNVEVYNMVKEKLKVDWRITIVALICIAIMQMYALYLGHNGFILTTVIGVFALAIGISLPQNILNGEKK